MKAFLLPITPRFRVNAAGACAMRTLRSSGTHGHESLVGRFRPFNEIVPVCGVSVGGSLLDILDSLFLLRGYCCSLWVFAMVLISPLRDVLWIARYSTAKGCSGTLSYSSIFRSPTFRIVHHSPT